MTPFLSLVAHDLYAKLHGNLSHTVVVFPGKRASLFFDQHLLAESGGQPLFAPTYMTLGELFGSLTDLRTDDTIRLVCLLHRHFEQCTDKHESIDSFYTWGELLLADFDDIDKNLVNPDMLFRNLKNYKELSSSTDFLTDEQREVLERFFDGFHASEGRSEVRKNFLRIWEAMAPIYHAFREGLRAEGRAYEGQLFRDVVEHFDASRLAAERYVFVGFNVLSAVERRLLDLIRDEGKALFYWDYDHYYLDNPAAEAGTFIRMDMHQYANALDEAALADVNPYDNLRRLPRIDIVSAPSDNAQASFVHDWLHDNLTKEREQETAVVLADEKLIMPVLHALPMDHINDINVTMGMPMTETSVYQFLTELLEEFEARGNDADRSADVEELQHMTEAIDAKGLEMKRLEHRLQEEEEALYRAHLAVNSLIRLVSEGTLRGSHRLIVRLLSTILRGTTIPFHGEPARGLQVMGVLETRNLDFRHLLLLSTNEGMLPKAPQETSFIPFSLRKAFGLTTIERQTAVYAYYFYRLIQRAERVTLVYNNGTNGLDKKIPSRFVTQLEVEFPGGIRHFALQSENLTSPTLPIEVMPTAETRRKLAKRFSRSVLSPSAIKDYYTCRLKFYLKYIEGLRFDKEDTDEVDERQFGNIFHDSAELAYKRLTEAGNVVQRKDLLSLAADEAALREIVRQAFCKAYWKTETDDDIHYTGIHLIHFRAVCKYLKQLLHLDAARAPFTYIRSELPVNGSVKVSTEDGPVAIQLGGRIDRLDEKEGTLRIIDYKTGSEKSNNTINNSVTSVAELFDHDVSKRKEKVFQTFYYAWLLKKNIAGIPELQAFKGARISPALLFVRSMFNADYAPSIQLNNNTVTDFGAEVYEEFDERMRTLLDEIFNSDVPYTQVENEDACKFCDFCAICGRKPKDFTT